VGAKQYSMPDMTTNKNHLAGQDWNAHLGSEEDGGGHADQLGWEAKAFQDMI